MPVTFLGPVVRGVAESTGGPKASDIGITIFAGDGCKCQWQEVSQWRQHRGRGQHRVTPAELFLRHLPVTSVMCNPLPAAFNLLLAECSSRSALSRTRVHFMPTGRHRRARLCTA